MSIGGQSRRTWNSGAVRSIVGCSGWMPWARRVSKCVMTCPLKGMTPARTVGVHAIAPEPRLVQGEHIHQIAPGGVAGDEDLRRVAAELRDVATVQATAAAASSIISVVATCGERRYSTPTTMRPSCIKSRGTSRRPPVSPPPWNQTRTGAEVAPSGRAMSRTHIESAVGTEVLRAIVYPALENVTLRPRREDREQEEKGRKNDLYISIVI